jgi:uncharacterized membrane protein
MGSPKRRRKTVPIAGKDDEEALSVDRSSAVEENDEEALSVDRSSAVEENVEAIKRWERAILLARSKAQQVSDWIASTAASGPVLVLHVVWFAAWLTLNAGAIRGIRPFDPFPFPLLTMTVSLEAIFLALFVLASQNRLARQADKRSHLDLQIDLLAEREMTAVLQLLQDIAGHLDVQTTVTPEQLRDLMKKTDLRRLTNRMEELTKPATAAVLPSTASPPPSSNAATS